MVHLYQVLDWEVFFTLHMFFTSSQVYLSTILSTPQKYVDQVLSSMDTLIVTSYDYHARMFLNKANF